MAAPAGEKYGLLASAEVPLPGMPVQLMVFGYDRHPQAELEDIVVIRPLAPPGDGAEAPLVRLHSACLTGDLFGSLKCDCGAQLRYALERIRDDGDGVLLYLLRDEGRG